jgi:hypothetical protein
MFGLKFLATLGVLFVLCAPILACTRSNAKPGDYVWNEVTSKAAFPQGYNYPVFVINEKMFAVQNGGWLSADGKNWRKTDLPESGLNSGYQDYVQFKGAIYALGTMQGNYMNMQLSSKIARTSDFKTWETLGEKSNLPERIFYGATVFRDKIWLVGGYDGKNYYNDAWNSADGVKWNRVAEKTAWSPRLVGTIVQFKNRLWIFGGGVIDGEKEINPDSNKEVWSSEDGVNWMQEKMKTERGGGGTPIVFDNKLWFVGVNRNDGNFDNAISVSADGVTWETQSAPWSPRGGVVVWIFGGKLFMTGGKYSYLKNGEPVFIYSNDVWAMSKRAE